MGEEIILLHLTATACDGSPDVFKQRLSKYIGDQLKVSGLRFSLSNWLQQHLSLTPPFDLVPVLLIKLVLTVHLISPNIH